MALLLAEDTEVQFTLGGGRDVEIAVTEDGALALEPALLGFGQELGAIRVVAGPDIGHGAVGELEAELHGLLDLGEELRLGLRQFLGRDRDRICIGRHAARVDRVDTHVQERAAAGELLLDAPSFAAKRETVGGLDLHERSELLGLGQTDEFLMIRIEVEAIADGEALAGLLARSDHRVALGGRNGHRLLADDMLAGAEGIDDVLTVNPRGRHHIDDVDRLVRRDLVPLVVRIDIGFVEAVELRELHALLTRAGDGGHQLHVLGLQQRRRQLAVRIIPQAAERETEGLAAGLRRSQGGSKGITGGQAAEGTEESTTSRAHRGARVYIPMVGAGKPDGVPWPPVTSRRRRRTPSGRTPSWHRPRPRKPFRAHGRRRERWSNRAGCRYLRGDDGSPRCCRKSRPSRR